MKIISYITDHNRASKNLEKSLNKYNYNYKFIGIGQKWLGFIQGKVREIIKYLQNEEKNDIYCVIDGYDILASNYPTVLEKKYLEFKTPIVFGGEKFCFSYNGTPLQKYKDVSMWASRKYLNGGFCIGERQDSLEMYSWVFQTGKEMCINDDQKLLGIYTNNFPDKISVDLYQKIIFNTITNIDTNSFAVKNGKLFIIPYQSYPCFVHFPASHSDGYSRYNKYGKTILGKEFWPLYGEKNWNVFANINMYIMCLIALLGLCFYLWKIKGIIVLFLIFLFIAKIYIHI